MLLRFTSLRRARRLSSQCRLLSTSRPGLAHPEHDTRNFEGFSLKEFGRYAVKLADNAEVDKLDKAFARFPKLCEDRSQEIPEAEDFETVFEHLQKHKKTDESIQWVNCLKLASPSVQQRIDLDQKRIYTRVARKCYGNLVSHTLETGGTSKTCRMLVKQLGELCDSLEAQGEPCTTVIVTIAYMEALSKLLQTEMYYEGFTDLFRQFNNRILEAVRRKFHEVHESNGNSVMWFDLLSDVERRAFEIEHFLRIVRNEENLVREREKDAKKTIVFIEGERVPYNWFPKLPPRVLLKKNERKIAFETPARTCREYIDPEKPLEPLLEDVLNRRAVDTEYFRLVLEELTLKLEQGDQLTALYLDADSIHGLGNIFTMGVFDRLEGPKKALEDITAIAEKFAQLEATFLLTKFGFEDGFKLLFHRALSEIDDIVRRAESESHYVPPTHAAFVIEKHKYLRRQLQKAPAEAELFVPGTLPFSEAVESVRHTGSRHASQGAEWDVHDSTLLLRDAIVYRTVDESNALARGAAMARSAAVLFDNAKLKTDYFEDGRCLYYGVAYRDRFDSVLSGPKRVDCWQPSPEQLELMPDEVAVMMVRNLNESLRRHVFKDVVGSEISRNALIQIEEKLKPITDPNCSRDDTLGSRAVLKANLRVLL
ncbi:MAG: hypothetical protein MHM6MM_002408 [Cercozoa sp. M6MM]